MKITEIYKKYQIMRNLQEHQLRVAAVASLICDNFAKPLDKKSIITACLLHDMGNIIKFNLNVFPEFLEPEGLDYWQKVKDNFIKKYGADEHEASYAIAKEVGVSNRVLKIMQGFGFSKGEKTYRSKNFELKIAAHSDHRVTPYGVTTLADRFQEAKKRYSDEKHPKFNSVSFDRLASYWIEVEKQIFAHCRLRPEEITDQSVNLLVEKLRDFEI